MNYILRTGKKRRKGKRKEEGRKGNNEKWEKEEKWKEGKKEGGTKKILIKLICEILIPQYLAFT